MVSLVQDNILELQNICKLHHVKSLYLICSATNSAHFNSNSGIDLLYKFIKCEISEMEYADNYFSLLSTLQKFFNRKVDLVAEEKISNPYFFSSINNQKETIYES